MSDKKNHPFDSFNLIYKILSWTGYFKLLNKPKNRWKFVFFQIYRVLSFVMAVVFNIQHLSFIVKKFRENKFDDVFDSLMIEIPQMNLIVKLLTLNLQTSRIEKVNKVINDPIFAPNNKKDEELLLRNNTSLHRLSKIINIFVSSCLVFWPANHFVRRYQDEDAVVPSYVPFETNTWGRYSIAVALEVVPLLWIGYGHLALDCLISAYYAQAEVQLKIMKNNLQCLFDVEDLRPRVLLSRYKDVSIPDLKKRLVYCVQRFDRLAWYTKEVNEIFNPAILFQFFTSSLSICMIAYRLSCTPILSVPFIFMVLVLVIVSTQVFLYCYYGSLINYESQSLVYSVYLSDWLSVSPSFCRLLLVAMVRWSRTLEPTVSALIPLSLHSFVSILKYAYSLYAILGSEHFQTN